MKRTHVVLTVLTAVVLCGAEGRATAQQPAASSKVTVALIGEDKVPMTRPYMRSTMAAAFEDALVATKRFRVISHSVMDDAMKAQARAASGIIDPATAIELGKVVQARYVVWVKQLGMSYALGGFLNRPTLNMSVQAQVINIQTTDIAESLSYTRQVAIGMAPPNGQPLPEDKLGKSYGDMTREIATEFVTTAAVSLMPLETLVLSADGPQVLLDAGSDVGVGMGAEFEVTVEGTPVPRPGRAPYIPKNKVARLKVSRVESEAAYAQTLETYAPNGVKDPVPDPTRLKVGAVARLVPTVTVAPKKK